MKTQLLNLLSLSLIFSLTPSELFSQDDEHAHDEPDVEIHVFEEGETWTNCSFVLHSSLSQSDFKRFTKEAGSIIYFQPLSGASSLGQFKFDIGLSMSSTPIDQISGAWNNTFGHPVSDIEEGPHWLGDKVSIPNIRFRIGLTDNIELGTYITKDFNGNYGFYGIDLKNTIVVDNNMNLAARVSHAQLFGPSSIKFNNTAIDALVSKQFSVIEPYIGLSVALHHGVETTDKLELTTENILAPRALIGAKLKYKWFSASAEYDVSSLNTFSFKIGTSF